MSTEQARAEQAGAGRTSVDHTTAAHSADGTAIAYEIHGDGPGVILIDGAMCYRDSGPMRPLCTQLDDDFAVLIYDRRGRGQSDDTLPYSVDRELDDLAALVDVLNETVGSTAPPALVGISSGGALTLRAAAHLGERVRSVVVYEPPYMPADLTEGAHEYTDALGRALASGDRDAALALFLARVGMPEQAIAGMRQSPAWRGMLALVPTLAYDDAVLGDSIVPTELVASIPVPVLAIAGGASPAMMQHGAREVAAAAARGAFDELAGQQHDADAAVLAAGIRRFLRP
ncbi:MAG TPA: alpha/beta hydrolase [Humibacter sp.]|jgi:pimeloyl-ACP methyl ester carboxylesterase|nr:alpha/beta hydrolase [Humibacter sp.]